MKYKLFKGNLHEYNVVAVSNNKDELINMARKSEYAMTVVELSGDIIFENEAQEKINNGVDKNMYNVIITKGDNERIIDSYADLSEAKEAKKRYESMPEYRDGLITIEGKTSKGTKIY